MIYNNTISDIRSNILEPWRMCGEYEDGSMSQLAEAVKKTV